ncbi:Transglutaminase-like enzyme, putative cysteine protease [Devosia sp. YR412]|uniref:transglutaminase-like domain-containing protein n=1 Tax=Devosia sp. YR412 TaxID=1881030 RepID=UPI0008B83790|nr:transglutaminase family protein [Devosia sp. YR412]SEQ26767.1 Transglutaminase-like enzyme, putative cysteine protease [Devosia sp. YR412]
MRFSVGCEIGYDVADSATLIFNIEAMRGGRQRVVSETLTITPDYAADEKTSEESGNRYLRLTVPQGMVQLRYEAQIELDPLHRAPAVIHEVPVATLPLDTLPFLNPSRYCPSDQLARFATRQFGNIEPGFGRVVEICNWINSEVDYLFGTSDTTTTAADTFSLRAGVCRDFAHLGITFCRALGIPARFVSCYAWQLEPQDFHAVFEAYLGDRWYLFDATRMATLDGMVRIGTGRDAADTAFATIYGQVLSQPIRVWSEAINGDKAEEWTTDAVSVTRD